MVIEESDFRLIPVKESGLLFDLELLKVINKGKENERTEFKNIAYGITIESALKYIANARINSKHNDSISLKQYLQEYKDIINSIKDTCKI